MTRDKALKLLHLKLKNQNLRRHCYAVEAVMRGIYKHLHTTHSKEEKENWGLAGLLHDMDYEKTKDAAHTQHSKKAVIWLKEQDAPKSVIDAVARHAWKFVEGAPMPLTSMDWALYTCDELTGFIIAVALIHPEKKLHSVTVERVLKKWNQKAFAAAVNRKQIELCEEKLDIKLEDFIQIAVSSMQKIHKELGL